MKYLSFHDPNEILDPKISAIANELLGKKEARAMVVSRLVDAINLIRSHPDEFLEQLRLNIEQELKIETSWEERDGMRLGLRFLELTAELRDVMKRVIPTIASYENEEEEKQHEQTINGPER